MKTPAMICFVYGALLVLGGIMGFAMAGSMASLIAGVGGGALCTAAGRGFQQRKSWALPLAIVVVLNVGAFFLQGLSDSSAPATNSTTTSSEAAAKKRESAKKRAMGMTALSALTLIGLLATGTRRK